MLTTARTDAILELLEPGALLGGALFRSLVAKSEAKLELPVGHRFGPFALLGELGRGGMGVVYLAERVDGEFTQQVAIKCVAAAQGEANMSLFRHERQLLAELKHPHIARLIDAGSTDGVLWFAMELVQGEAFDLHLQKSKLNLDARLKLIQQVASALSAAHARLLVHRDVKPSNVMIDVDGSAKLLDFGIASVANDGDSARAYTPAWASPEQLALAPTGPASDQYQLGKLLTIALEDQVLAGARGAELNAIAAKACAEIPELRYGSVADFSQDLQRWLNRLPVYAVGNGLWYSLRCAVRRHPWISSATAAALLFAVLSALWFNHQLQAERDLARAQAERANATKNYLLSLFQDGDPTRGTDPNLTARELIQAGVARVETDQSLPKLVRQELLALMVEIQLRLGDSSTAKRLLGNLDTSLDATLLQRNAAQLWSARVAIIEGKPAQAHKQLQAIYAREPTDNLALMLARAELDAGLSKEAEQRINALLASKALSATHMSSALLTLAVIQTRTGRLLEAIATNQQALSTIARATPAVSPAPAYINLALAQIDLARFDEALANLDRAEKTLVTFPHQRNQFLILQNRGMALFRSGDSAAANQVWQDLLERAEHGVNPGIEASTVHNLAAISDVNDDPVQAIAYSHRASRLRTQLGDLPGALSSNINIASKLSALGLHRQAIGASEAAITQALTLGRLDLQTRAELNAAVSHCHLTPGECGTRLQTVTLKFLEQNNLVKAQEALEKLINYGYLVGDKGALVAAGPLLQRFAEKSRENAELSAQLQQLERWLDALQQENLSQIHALAAEDVIKQLVTVQTALRLNNTARAAEYLAKFSAQREDYWRLKAQIATLQKDTAAAQSAQSELANLQARALAVLGD
jgi:hypothetical protein